MALAVNTSMPATAAGKRGTPENTVQSKEKMK